MSDSSPTFAPCFLGEMPAGCRTCVVLPARNEEHSLPRTLDALRHQVGLDGRPIDPRSYEVLLLLNNCTDESALVARRYKAAHPSFRLQIEERTFAEAQAHVGTARRLLMNAACERLERTGMAGTILSTDADTEVAPEWIARNRLHLEAGADVVGGIIHLSPRELESLDPGTRTAYLRDRKFQRLVARLESLLDPDPADPWPRHLEHFGASLGCTCEIYRRAGGMPAIKPLEDVAFVDALRKVGARIRHAVDVHIFTSARLDGRAEVGLSGQLRHWRLDSVAGRPQIVDSAAWLAHRFRSIHRLRVLNRSSERRTSLAEWPAAWRQRIAQRLSDRLPEARFLELLDCNALIEQSFCGGRHSEITAACRGLEELIQASLQVCVSRDAELSMMEDGMVEDGFTLVTAPAHRS